jgi:hypothetical protein
MRSKRILINKASCSLGNWSGKKKIALADAHSRPGLRSLWRKGKGKKGYETKRENRAAGSDGVHFALASWGADSSFAFVFSAARLHIEARGRGAGDQPGESRRNGRTFCQANFYWPARFSLVALPREVD